MQIENPAIQRFDSAERKRLMREYISEDSAHLNGVMLIGDVMAFELPAWLDFNLWLSMRGLISYDEATAANTHLEDQFRAMMQDLYQHADRFDGTVTESGAGF